ncbi:MAG TPA: hypothetical protein VGK59_16350 [Ohtaekwangia sp.]
MKLTIANNVQLNVEVVRLHVVRCFSKSRNQSAQTSSNGAI